MSVPICRIHKLTCLFYLTCSRASRITNPQTECVSIRIYIKYVPGRPSCWLVGWLVCGWSSPRLWYLCDFICHVAFSVASQICLWQVSVWKTRRKIVRVLCVLSLTDWGRRPEVAFTWLLSLGMIRKGYSGIAYATIFLNTYLLCKHA